MIYNNTSTKNSTRKQYLRGFLYFGFTGSILTTIFIVVSTQAHIGYFFFLLLFFFIPFGLISVFIKIARNYKADRLRNFALALLPYFLTIPLLAFILMAVLWFLIGINYSSSQIQFMDISNLLTLSSLSNIHNPEQ